MSALQGKKIAILVAHGFEQSELVEPKTALETAGAAVDIVSPEPDTVKGWNKKEWGTILPVDVNLADVQAADYDALLLPGGVMNPDSLRINSQAIRFVKDMHDAQKPIAAICHGPWLLIEANIVKNKKLTSWKSIKNDLINAGAQWSDEEVVLDQDLLTSRCPQDIPAFNKAMIELFGSANH